MIPKANPVRAGRNAIFPIWADWSMLGMSSDHTEAATITPAANPARARSRLSFISRLKKRTQDAPKAVPRNGSNNIKTKPDILLLYMTSL